MKKILITGLVLALSATHASAVEHPVSALRQVYTCEGGGLSRVAARVEAAPCCTGLLGCPQLLSNTGLVKPKRVNRT